MTTLGWTPYRLAAWRIATTLVPAHSKPPGKEPVQRLSVGLALNLLGHFSAKVIVN